jgi:hypothetical protein
MEASQNNATRLFDCLETMTEVLRQSIIIVEEFQNESQPILNSKM